MADAMNVTGGKPSINQIYVNWKQLTAKEVIKKEKEGQIAPPEILKWAEEIAKMDNAPDDVTYDIAQGVTDIDRLNELINANEALTTQENSEENTDNPEETDEKNGAQQFRQGLEDNGTSLKSQGKIMTAMSASAQGLTINMMNGLSETAQEADAINAQADALADKTVSDSEQMKQEYDNLMDRANSDTNPLSREERSRLAALGVQLGQTGTEAQQQLQNMSVQVGALNASLAPNAAITQNAANFGVETTDIGLQLLGKDETQRGETSQQLSAGGTEASAGKTIKNAIGRINIFKMLFNSNYRTGLKAAAQGGATIDTATEGNNAVTAASEQIKNNTQNINSDKQKVENTTNVKAQDNASANPNSNNDNADKAKEEANAQEQQDLTLADSTVTTDADEIIKRKARKGLS